MGPGLVNTENLLTVLKDISLELDGLYEAVQKKNKRKYKKHIKRIKKRLKVTDPHRRFVPLFPLYIEPTTTDPAPEPTE